MSEIVQRGKIKKAPSEEVVNYLIRPAITTDLERSYNTILDINKAHVLMLAKQGILTRDEAKKILSATLKIEAEKDNPTFEINPNVEDLYFNLERYLIKLTGLEIGGKQHTARSRNDLFATEIRMDTRRYFLKISTMFNELRKTILDLAETQADTVMSGYTHMQPSEPITFGHYLVGVSSALARDYSRFEYSWNALNLNPLGGCSMGSTSFPIDREYTTKLLGFDAPVMNSIDCVASRDYALAIATTLAQAANTMSRCAQDLYNWATPEYGYIELDDSCSGCSSIMPQKKNPFTLEHVKAKAAHIEGFVISIFNGMKNVFFSHCRDISVETCRFFWTCMQEMEADLALFNVTLKTLSVRPERMLENATKNFCTVTELANYLVRYDKISFREAHEIIADVVANMCERHLTSADIDVEAINEVFTKKYGFRTSLTNVLVKEALDPRRVVSEKKVIGGTEHNEVLHQIEVLRKRLEADEKKLSERKDQVEQANKELTRKVSELIA